MLFSLSVSGFAFDYPKGVSEKTASQSAEKTDILIKNMLADTQGKTLEELALPMIVSDETLSTLLLSVYSSMSEQETSLRTFGIDISVENVANALAAYPGVTTELLKTTEWSSVDLSAAKWGAKNKYDFANAVAAMLYPFGDVLYMLLCGETYKAGLITLKGDYGYENGIIPMLKALGCTEITPNDSFISAAGENRNTMVYNIILSVFSALEKIFASPAMRLSETMPNLAYYIKNGGLEASVNSLMSPLTRGVGKYASFFTGSNMLTALMFFQDPQKYTADFGNNFTTILNEGLASSGFQIAELDLDKLASCGTVVGDTVKANIGEAYTTIFTWLIDTVKLNKDELKNSLSQQDGDISKFMPVMDNLLSKETDALFAFIVELFTKTGGKDVDYEWKAPTFTAAQATYTANLGADKFQRVLDGIDGLLGDFIAESTGEKNLTKYLKKTIYSSNLVSQLAVGLYSGLSGDDMAGLTALLGDAFSPATVAKGLTEKQFTCARNTLLGCKKWSSVNPEKLNWGFGDGDRDGFEKAVVAVLRPFEDALRMMLVSDTLEIYGSIRLGGSNGYNTAVIPVLEALGCPSESIMSYDEFKKASGGDGIIKNLFKPVFALVDKVAEKPVYNLTEILPNVVFFVSNGSLMQCVMNLVVPILGLLDELSLKAEDLGLNLDELKNTDILAKLDEGMAQMEDVKLAKLDFKTLAGLGEAQTYQSKATFGGAPVTMTYVKADRTGVMAFLVHYLVKIISNPENSGLLDGMMGSGEGGGTFGEFSSGIGDQFAEMSEDELIEWLYQLFFRERPVKEEPTADGNYSTAFVYEETKEKDNKYIAPVIIILLVVVIVLVIIFRKKIFAVLKNIKFKKAEYVLAEEGEM